jgi:hypothetical protein
VISRLSKWSVRFVLGCDKLLCVWLRGWAYVWLNRGDLPETDESISGFVGKSALEGKGWALVAEKIVDAVFGAGHCRAAIARDGED